MLKAAHCCHLIGGKIWSWMQHEGSFMKYDHQLSPCPTAMISFVQYLAINRELDKTGILQVAVEKGRNLKTILKHGCIHVYWATLNIFDLLWNGQFALLAKHNKEIWNASVYDISKVVTCHCQLQNSLQPILHADSNMNLLEVKNWLSARPHNKIRTVDISKAYFPKMFRS